MTLVYILANALQSGSLKTEVLFWHDVIKLYWGRLIFFHSKLIFKKSADLNFLNVAVDCVPEREKIVLSGDGF